MEHFNGHHQGNMSLTNDLEISGVVGGTVTVPPGRYLLLHGMISGDLIVQGGGATVYGTVVGTVLNHDGDVEIFGMVGGVQDSGVRKTVIDNKAVVGSSN